MSTVSHTNTSTIKAEQMREIAAKNQTAHGLLLLFALNTTNTKDLSVPEIKKELTERGVPVTDISLYDALQDLEDLGLGAIIYAKKSSDGDDVFRRDYNLTKFAGRAFPASYINEWKIKFDQEDEEDKIKLVDRRIQFQEPLEERRKNQKASLGKPGRPKGYSHTLGRFMTKEEMEAKEFKMTHPNPPGRPWHKEKNTSGLKAKLADIALAQPKKRGRPLSANAKETLSKAAKAAPKGKPGRPAAYSLKLGRYFTPAELAERAKAKMVKKKAGRPVGWRKDPAKRITPVRTPKVSTPVRQTGNVVSKMPTLNMGAEVPKGQILNLPLSKNRSLYIVLPKKFNKDDLALLNLNLEHFVKNN